MEVECIQPVSLQLILTQGLDYADNLSNMRSRTQWSRQLEWDDSRNCLLEQVMNCSLLKRKEQLRAESYIRSYLEQVIDHYPSYILKKIRWYTPSDSLLRISFAVVASSFLVLMFTFSFEARAHDSYRKKLRFPVFHFCFVLLCRFQSVFRTWWFHASLRKLKLRRHQWDQEISFDNQWND